MMKTISTCAAIAATAVAVVWLGSESPSAQQPSARPAAAKPAQPAGPWPPVKLKDGQPDVSGFYQSTAGGGGAGTNMEPIEGAMGRPGISPGIVVDPPDGMIPYLPWARARRNEVQKDHLRPNQAQVDTRNRGWPDGVPRINYYFVNPFEIRQTSGAVLIMYETQHEFRYIPIDGRPQPDSGVKMWMGSSRGRWEGTTLVVEVTNINDRVRYTVAGDFASDDVKITERWQWTDADTVKYSATFEDPKVYSRPFTIAKVIKRLHEKNFEILEYAGVEGEKDAHLMVDIPATLNKK